MTEIDVLRAQIIRQDVTQSWGFRLQGGAQVGEPLRLARVTPGSPAARIGLREGDEVTEIDNTPTDHLTCQQSIDLIDQHADSLLLTIERKARGSIPVNPVLFSSSDQFQQKSYQTYDLSGATQPTRNSAKQRKYDYQMVQSKSFESVLPPPANRPQQLSFQPQSTFLPSPPHPPHPGAPASHPVQASEDFYSTPPPPYPRPSDSDAFHQLQQQQQSPQSRTFKLLQSVMENDEPFAGVSGLPPPRSASLEQLKRENTSSFHHPHHHRQTFSPSSSTSSPQAPLPPHLFPTAAAVAAAASSSTPSSNTPSSSRVKVLMPQQYNSPLAMYSADNVLETFKVQAESLLNVIERKQHCGDEQGPMVGSYF